jgi:hypothetical protein
MPADWKEIRQIAVQAVFDSALNPSIYIAVQGVNQYPMGFFEAYFLGVSCLTIS